MPAEANNEVVNGGAGDTKSYSECEFHLLKYGLPRQSLEHSRELLEKLKARLQNMARSPRHAARSAELYRFHFLAVITIETLAALEKDGGAIGPQTHFGIEWLVLRANKVADQFKLPLYQETSRLWDAFIMDLNRKTNGDPGRILSSVRLYLPEHEEIVSLFYALQAAHRLPHLDEIDMERILVRHAARDDLPALRQVLQRELDEFNNLQ